VVPVFKWQRSYHRTAPRNKILAYLRGKQVECDGLDKTKVFVLALKKISAQKLIIYGSSKVMKIYTLDRNPLET
jgi:hypothetical protein